MVKRPQSTYPIKINGRRFPLRSLQVPQKKVLNVVTIDETADIETAINIVENAKMSRPSVCNATEVCLVNKKIANEFLPLLKKRR